MVLTKDSTESEWIYIVKSVKTLFFSRFLLIFSPILIIESAYLLLFFSFLKGRLAILKRLSEVSEKSLKDTPSPRSKTPKKLLFNAQAHENYLIKKIQDQNELLLQTSGGKFKGLPDIRVETNGIFYKNNPFDNRPKDLQSRSKRMPKLSKVS